METPDAFLAKVYNKVRATIKQMPLLTLNEKKGLYGVLVSEAIRKAFRVWMDTSKTFTSLPLDERSTVTYVLAVYVAMSLQTAGSNSDSGGTQASVSVEPASGSSSDSGGTQASVICRMLCAVRIYSMYGTYLNRSYIL
jgi:hypothetical protein